MCHRVVKLRANLEIKWICLPEFSDEPSTTCLLSRDLKDLRRNQVRGLPTHAPPCMRNGMGGCLASQQEHCRLRIVPHFIVLAYFLFVGHQLCEALG